MVESKSPTTHVVFFNLLSKRFKISVSEYFSHFFLQTSEITCISKQYGNFKVFDKKIQVPNTFSLYKLNEVEEKCCIVTFTPGIT